MTRHRAARRIRRSLATAGTLVAALTLTPLGGATADPEPGPAPATAAPADPSQRAHLGRAGTADPGYGVYRAPRHVERSAGHAPAVPEDPTRVTFRRTQPLSSALDGLDPADQRRFAAQNDMSVGKLERLAEDETLHVSRDGGLFYVDPVAQAPEGDVAPHSTPFDAPFPLSDTFFLHSAPGSSKVLYLDLDGYALPAGTAWKGGAAYNAPAFDPSGNGPGFTNDELARIQNIWQRVSEDYGSLDIDVTTQYPGYAAINRASAADTTYGGRVVITGASWDEADICGTPCGGVSYVGVIDKTGATHDYYQPSWVFEPNVAGSKATAEATSHEFGHAAGLSHDGTSTQGYYAGHNMWAPIMGVGYYRPVVQFSRGEYPDANNTEDDYAVMGSHGLVARGDDHGNAFGSGTWIYNGNTASGIIERQTDGDMFQFTSCGGPVTISANPSPVSPNLDLRLFLYNSSNGFIDSDDPLSGTVSGDVASGMSAQLTESLAYGQTYQVWVDRASRLPATSGYSTYGSRGFYQVEIDQQRTCDLYAMVNDPTTASYTIGHGRWANPAGNAPTVTHNSVGSYAVAFPGAVVVGGDVQVTAMTQGVTCNSAGWSSSTASVSCRNSAGALVDSRFSLLYTHDDDSAYVWAHSPSTAGYTPSPVWSHNPSGRPIRITRSGVGSYAVHFPGYTGADGGNVEVTSYSSGDVRCVSNGWGDQVAYVRCRDSADNPVDSAFDLLFTKRQSAGYAWADQPGAASYSPAAYWAQNPGGGGLTIKHLGVGRYKAVFAGLAGGLGNVQASAYNENNDCNVIAWSNDTVRVNCTNASGARVDSRYDLLFIPAGAISCGGSAVTVDLSVGDHATRGRDVVLGTEGSDVFDTRAGNDKVCALGGNDFLRTSGGSDRVYAGPGKDVVRAGGSRDQVLGGSGSDRGYGQGGNDRVSGQAGRGDLCNGGTGTDTRGSGCERTVGIP